ncbi:MAG: DUF3365 domain-containing protein, partial [Desulfobacteraceae bacterium]|nr:DUF3365 domain-containing protein [Desulfobacteraceae bacterium]
FESEFITKLNTDSGLKMASGTRTFDGVISFYVLRRGEVMGDTCLRCHSTPDAAPQEMVLQYGLERSFKRELGETVSAISIRIPLAAAYKDVNAVSAVISVVLTTVLLMIFIIQHRLTRRIIVEPVEVIRTKALSVANNSKNIGEQIHHTAGKELAELISAFNAMSLNLKKHADHLEDMVDERTHELSTVNEKLRREIEGHHQTEAALKKEKDKLAEALAKVKTLSGLVPICSQCKKVRDDKGYWNQIETYIETHTDALFSHGLCSECGDKLYGEQEWFKKKKRRENKNK